MGWTRTAPAAGRLLPLGLQALLFAAVAAGLPLPQRRGTTIVVPGPVIDHGLPNLLCTPPKWMDVALFYLGNYAAHAATVRTLPGEPWLDQVFKILAVLLFPQAGVRHGLNAIVRCAVLAKDPLQRAARSNALCMVIRDHNWKPLETEPFDSSLCWATEAVKSRAKGIIRPLFNDKTEAEKILNAGSGPVLATMVFPPWVLSMSRAYWFYSDVGIFVPRGREIHGRCQLPRGYTLAFVPHKARVRMHGADGDAGAQARRGQFKCTVSASFNRIKALVAVLQALYSSFTLYHTRGDQLKQYGFAAFGLTVTPFLVMSVINLLGSLVTPEYAAMYMVRSETMDEAVRRGAVIDGTVGELVPASHPVAAIMPVDFSATVASYDADTDEFELRDISILGRRQPPAPEPAAAAGDDDDDDDAPATASAGNGARGADEGADAGAVSDAGAGAGAGAGGGRRAIKLRWQIFKPGKVPEPQVTVTVPCCNDFAMTHEPAQGLPRLITDNRLLFQQLFKPHFSNSAHAVAFYSNIVACSLPVAIIGGISHFGRGNSTTAQRAWTMLWLSFGFMIGMYPDFTRSPTELLSLFRDPDREANDPGGMRYDFALTMVGTAVYAATAIGGYVTVGKMMNSYGTCVDIG